MADERPSLTPDEFGRAVGLLLASAPFERQLTDWGAAHAAALAAIRQSHPHHYAAARRAYAARLVELRSEAL